MLRSIYNSWSGIALCERSLGQTAHNLANLNTTAFNRAEIAPGDTFYRTLQERRLPHSSEEGLAAGQGVHLQAVVPFTGQGVLQETGRPLDLAISGAGYFRLLDPAGGVLYSRNGSFNLDAAGRIVSASGDYLDLPFSLARGTAELTIGPGGLLSSAGEVLGQIRLYRFVNPGGLTADGAGRYQESALSGAPEEGLPGSGGCGRICQYYLEQSGADTALEMVQLLLAQRALQANVRSLITADELQALLLQIKL